MLAKKDSINQFKIISIGCGSGIDYCSINSLLLEIDNTVEIKYIGVDQINWDRDFNVDNNSKFRVQNLENWSIDYKSDYNNTNIIFFGKSIGEFDNSQYAEFVNNMPIIERKYRSEQIAIAVCYTESDEDCQKNRLDEFVNRICILNEYIEVGKIKSVNKNDDSSYVCNYFDCLSYPRIIEQNLTNLKALCKLRISNNDRCCSNSCADNNVFYYPIQKIRYIMNYEIRIIKRRKFTKQEYI